MTSIGLCAPTEAVNDTLIGLVAGATDGWGIAVVSGTGCNCWGWDRDRRQGQVTGGGWQMGEYAGSSELAARAVQLVAYEWTRRGPATQLTPALMRYPRRDGCGGDAARPDVGAFVTSMRRSRR